MADVGQGESEITQEVPIRDRVLSEIESIVSDPDEVRRTGRTDQFIEKRVAELTESSKPTELSLAPGVIYEGFIHPETRIRRNFMVDAVRINDPEIYKVLLESFRKFKEDPAWQGKSMREIAQQALVQSLGVYFGNYFGVVGGESRNREFYLDHISANSEDMSIQEFRGKGFGVCAEKAPVAQNLLAFMGYDSELVMSDNNRLISPDLDDEGGHVYIVISNEKGHFIYDPTNPVVVNKTDGSLQTVLPSNYAISEEQYESLIKGGQVGVNHSDLVWDGSTYKKKESVSRVYGGPKNAKIASWVP